MPTHRRSRSRGRPPSRTVTFAVALALALGLYSPAHAEDPAQMREELAGVEGQVAELDERTQQVERELARTTEELSLLEEQLAEVSRKLLDAQARERAATEDAELARGQAEHALEQLGVSEDALAENIGQLEGLARDTYKFGAPRNSVVSLVGSVTIDEGPGQFVDAVHYLNRGIGNWSLLVERSEALVVQIDAAAVRAEEERRRQEELLADAAEARDDAAEAHAEAADLVSRASLHQHRQEQLIIELGEARAEATARIGDLKERIEAEERRRAEEARRRAEEERRRAEEARRQAEERRRAEAQAAREAEAQAAREAEARAARDAAAREEAEAAERRRVAAQERQRSSASSPERSAPTSSSSSSNSSSRSANPSASAPSTRIVNNGSGLVTVGGITVSSSLGPALQSLLDAARADGIVLGGQGWRSMDAQASLRVANGCRDVYTSPPSSCRIPTAIPGSSEHEKGLAIDFTWQGRTICYPQRSASCHGNAAFDWLRANAGKYGLRNLPAEAWHWSTTGR